MSDYISIEKSTHDRLVKWVEHGLESLYETWKQQKRVPPFFFCWPSQLVLDEAGNAVQGVCQFELDEIEPSLWIGLFRQAIDITNAHALVLVEQREKNVRVLFESPHGTRSWTLPIERHGNVDALGRASIKDNTDYLGLFWRLSGPVA